MTYKQVLMTKRAQDWVNAKMPWANEGKTNKTPQQPVNNSNTGSSAVRPVNKSNTGTTPNYKWYSPRGMASGTLKLGKGLVKGLGPTAAAYVLSAYGIKPAIRKVLKPWSEETPLQNREDQARFRDYVMRGFIR